MRGYEMATPREVDPYLRKFVLNRDGYVCQMCYCGMCDKPLHVHHINGVRKVPVMANDPDNCITLCVDCHENIHSVIGCRKVDYQCK